MAQHINTAVLNVLRIHLRVSYMSQATTKSILLSGLHCSTGPDQLAERQLDYKILEATRIMDNARWTPPALIILTTGCSP